MEHGRGLPEGAENWKAPDDKPKSNKIGRRAALGGILGLGFAAEEIIRRRESHKEPQPRTEIKRPELSTETISKEFSLAPEETQLVKDLSQDINFRDIVRILNVDGVKDEKTRKELLERGPLLGVSGMEDLGLNSKEVRSLIIQRMPKGLFFSLHEIRYENSDTPMGEAYGKNFKSTNSAARAETNNGAIIFSKGQKEGLIPWQIMETLRHEAGHFLAPSSNRLLTRQERLKLQKDLIDRMKAKNKRPFAYENAIINDDKKAELFIRSEEYLGDLMGEYLSAVLTEYTPEDEKLLQTLITKTQPDFNKKKAAELESKILDKWNEDYFRNKRQK
jgi:hypothetical protein